MSRKKTTPKKARLAAALLLALPAAVPAPAALSAPAAVPAPAAPASKCDAALSRLLASPTQPGWSAVIAHTGGPLTPAQLSQLAGLKAAVTRRLPLIGSVSLRVPTRNLSRLAALPFVSHLSYDGTVKKSDAFIVNSSGAGTAYQQYGLTGAGVTVAVIDSGIQACHQDVRTSNGTYRVLAAPDFTVGSGATCWTDYCGHGTHVAGIVAGNGSASSGPHYTQTFYGIARQAQIVSVRVLGSSGVSTVSAVISGIQWVIQNQNSYGGIRVMNLSLGHPVGESYKTDPLCQAVEQAWKAGIVVVCAAGNSGRQNTWQSSGAANEGWGTAYGSIQSPGNDPYVITVGATKATDGNRWNDRIATYSSRGPSRLDMVLKPDIIAPGNRVISLDVDYSTLNSDFASTNLIPYSAYATGSGTSNQSGAGMSNEYFQLSGTSMASPVVAGAAALLLQKYPSLSPDTVKARLMASADKWADPQGGTDPCTYGAGYLDIPNALNSGVTVPGWSFALSPRMLQDGSGNVTIDTSVIGSRSVWGSGSLTDLRSVWGTRSVWGSSYSALSASSAAVSSMRSVWGSRSVWGASTSAVDLSSVAVYGEN